MDLAAVVYVSSGLTFGMITFYLFQDILTAGREMAMVKEESH